MNTGDRALLWDKPRLYELVHRLAHRGRLHPGWRDVTASRGDEQDLSFVLKRAAQAAGAEIRPAKVSYSGDAAGLSGLAPAVVHVRRAEGALFLGILGILGSGRKVVVLDPSGHVRLVSRGQIRRVLAGPDDARRQATEVDEVLGLAAPQGRRSARLRQALLNIYAADAAPAVWVLQAGPASTLATQLRQGGLVGALAGLAVLYTLRSALLVFSWWLLGKSALNGRLEPAILGAWALVLFTYVVTAVAVEWRQGVLHLRVNVLYRRKILHGATRVDPDTIRGLGPGQLLGKAVETEALDSLVVAAGLNGLAAVMDLATALLLFAVIPQATLAMLLYCAWIAFVSLTGWRLYRSQQRWSALRVAMANGFVEDLMGRHTRMAQAPRESWHQEEDRQLSHYAAASRELDRQRARYGAVSTHGWLVLGMLALAPAVVQLGTSVDSLAAIVGCIVLSYFALGNLTAGIEALASAAVSWGQARDLYRASSTVDRVGLPDITELRAPDRRSVSNVAEVVLEASGVRYAHARHAEPVLRDVDFTLRQGARVLLEGRSGCGKTTLAMALCGLRRPDSGTILLRGFDIGTLGEAYWANRIAYAPQFKDNYVFAETLAFNLLMGRCWPPRPIDLAEAETVCTELGLGPLLDRMPARLHERVGEGGWKLSHGERTRIYLARALLQQPDIVILDESFGALDAEATRQCLASVLARAPALVVITHD